MRSRRGGDTKPHDRRTSAGRENDGKPKHPGHPREADRRTSASAAVSTQAWRGRQHDTRRGLSRADDDSTQADGRADDSTQADGRADHSTPKRKEKPGGRAVRKPEAPSPRTPPSPEAPKKPRTPPSPAGHRPGPQNRGSRNGGPGWRPAGLGGKVAAWGLRDWAARSRAWGFGLPNGAARVGGG